MSNDVLNFLTKLATEPQVFSEFIRDARAVLQREGVDEKTQEALLSRDPTRVYAAIRGEAAAYESAYERSLKNAKTVMDILASDPAVAAWLYATYSQAIQLSGAGYGAYGAAIPAAMPGSQSNP